MAPDREPRRLQGRMIYLDYQATTPVAPEAATAMRPWEERNFANPHSPSREGREAAAAIEVARDQVEAAIGLEGRKPGLHFGRDRSRSTGRSRGLLKRALPGATASSRRRPSMPRCSIRSNGSKGGASRSSACRSGQTG